MSQVEYTLTIGGQTKRSRFKPRTMGLVAFDPASLPVTIGGVQLPEKSVEHIVRYGLTQYVADGGAVGKDGDEALFIAKTDAKLAGLLSGDLRAAKGEALQGPIDNAEVLAKRMAKQEIQTAIKAALDSGDQTQVDFAKALKADKERLATTIAAHFENGKDAFLKAAQAEIDARHKTAAKVDLKALGLGA